MHSWYAYCRSKLDCAPPGPKLGRAAEIACLGGVAVAATAIIVVVRTTTRPSRCRRGITPPPSTSSRTARGGDVIGESSDDETVVAIAQYVTALRREGVEAVTSTTEASDPTDEGVGSMDCTGLSADSSNHATTGELAAAGGDPLHVAAPTASGSGGADYHLDIDDALRLLSAYTKRHPHDGSSGGSVCDGNRALLPVAELRLLCLEHILRFVERSVGYHHYTEAASPPATGPTVGSVPRLATYVRFTFDIAQCLEYVEALSSREFRLLDSLVLLQEGPRVRQLQRLSKVRTALRWERVANAVALLKWMGHAMTRRVWSIAMTAVGATMLGYLRHYGLSLGEQLESHLRSCVRAIVSNGGQQQPQYRPLWFDHVQPLAKLLAVEVGRRVLVATISNAMKGIISATTASFRDDIKHELHFALCRVPLGFFATHSQDEIDQILCYANDLEGVDVHLQYFFVDGSHCVMALFSARQAVGGSWTPLLWMGGTAVFSALLQSVVIPAIKRALKRRGLDGSAVGGKDGVEVETQARANSGSSAPMMSAAVIIENVETLRPHAADRSLMREWYRHLARETDTEGRILSPRSNPRVALQRMSRKVLAAFVAIPTEIVHAIDVLNSLFIPVAATAALASVELPGQQGPLPLSTAVEVHRVVDNMVSHVRRLVDFSGLVDRNGHKARTLHVLLDPSLSEDYYPPQTVRSGSRSTTSSRSSGDAHQGKRSVVPVVLGGAPLPLIRSISFANVSFAYPSRPERGVLRQLSLTIPLLLPGGGGDGAGEKEEGESLRPGLIAITGASGCGKSTLLALLLRLYPLQAGAIHLNQADGTAPIDLASLDPTMVRRALVGYVPQRVPVFSGTITQNIALRQQISIVDTVTLEAVRAAGRIAGCDSFVGELPEGYHTRLGEKGMHLSGGQLQRLGIARALYLSAFCDQQPSHRSSHHHHHHRHGTTTAPLHDEEDCGLPQQELPSDPSSIEGADGGVPPKVQFGCQVLLMDEPTSSLDAQSKALILQYLREEVVARRGISIVAVTHDPVVVAAADCVVSLAP